ncbi:MAG: hypothetical protein LUC34_07995 [Campylobacter sp.]|nr:hypothetical protein [Campylobacter sp.]
MVFEKIKHLVSQADIAKLSKQLGYVRERNFAMGLYRLNLATDLADFLQRGHFDWCHSSQTLIFALARLYKLDITHELQDALTLNDERRKLANAYIYIDTNFKHTSEPIHVLSVAQGYRYIGLKPIVDELCFKSLQERLEIIGKVVKLHFEQTKTLPIFGEITGYKACFCGEAYSFDTHGELSDKEIFEKVATLRI